MFEESLINEKRAQVPRRRKTYLGLAFLLHGCGFLVMLFFQYWTVEALQAPPIPVSFFTAAALPPQPPPPPAPRPVEPVNAAPQPPAPPEIPVQPTAVPDAEPQPAPDPLPQNLAFTTFSDATTAGGPPATGDFLPSTGTGPGTGTEASENAIVYVGGEVKRPIAIHQPKPSYSETARKARIQGAVVLEAIIDKEGNVVDLKVLKGLPFGLSEEAVKAVRQWKFRPATLNGKPVAVFYNLTANFGLM